MRKIIRLIATGTLIFALGFAARVAGADWSIGGFAGYYSPAFGEVNEWDEWYEESRIYGVDLKLGAGVIYGITAEYGISPNFALRGEIKSFSTKTSGTGYRSWSYYEEEWDLDFELTMRSVVLSGIYRLPLETLTAYMGAGVGQFATRAELTTVARRYWDDAPEDTWTQSLSQSDSPIGLEFLGGIEYGIKNFLLAAEIKYTAAKADMGYFRTADLSGLSLILRLLLKF